MGFEAYVDVERNRRRSENTARVQGEDCLTVPKFHLFAL
jgi:hypothetical protein